MKTYEVKTKETNPQIYAYIHRNGSVMNLTELMNKAYDDIFSYIKSAEIEPIFPCFGLYPDPEFNPNNINVHACVPINAEISEKGDVKVASLPQQKVVSTIHEGKYEELKGAYDALRDWFKQNNTQPIGSPREIYIIGALDTQNPEEYRTEIVFPIKG